MHGINMISELKFVTKLLARSNRQPIRQSTYKMIVTIKGDSIMCTRLMQNKETQLFLILPWCRMQDKWESRQTADLTYHQDPYTAYQLK